MQLGNLKLTTVSGGRFVIDGGTMFGVVPKALWSRYVDVDERNLIRQATNCVLVEDGETRVLIDTGYGLKLSEKERRNFQSEPGDPLVESLAEAGVTPEQIDVVVLSHLHFDHAGGATRHDDDGGLTPAFPNAEYVAQKLEWEVATSGVPELRGAYPQQNLLPLEESGRLRLVDGDEEIVPGVRYRVTGGHTRGHCAVYIESQGETAVYLADVCPMWQQLKTLWCMAYDVDLLQTRRIKPVLLGEIADNGWLALSDHDPDHAAARIKRDKQRDFKVIEAFESM